MVEVYAPLRGLATTSLRGTPPPEGWKVGDGEGSCGFCDRWGRSMPHAADTPRSAVVPGPIRRCQPEERVPLRRARYLR